HVRQREKAVQDLLNLYEFNAKDLRVLDRARLALSNGLAKKALDVLLASDVPASAGPEGVSLGLQLLLTAGRVREGREWLTPAVEAALSPESAHWLRAELAAALGDYAGADDQLAQMVVSSLPLAGAGGRTITFREAMALAATQAVLEGALCQNAPGLLL